jgi:hypothetical protein
MGSSNRPPEMTLGVQPEGQLHHGWPAESLRLSEKSNRRDNTRRTRVPMTLAGLLIMFVISACSGATRSAELTESHRTAIADTIRTLLVTAYDLSDSTKVVDRLMSLYPSSGRVVSATAGRVTTDRDSLESAVTAFWTNIGQYMRGPKWEWGPMEIDVLSADAAAVTASYTIPHHTTAGAPHVLGGVWTSVWGRRDGSWRILQEHLSDMPRPLAEALERRMRPASDSSPSH